MSAYNEFWSHSSWMLVRISAGWFNQAAGIYLGILSMARSRKLGPLGGQWATSYDTNENFAPAFLGIRLIYGSSRHFILKGQRKVFLLFFSEMLSSNSWVCVTFKGTDKNITSVWNCLKITILTSQIREVRSEVQPIPSIPLIARILNPRIEDPRSLAVYDIRGASCISDAVL